MGNTEAKLAARKAFIDIQVTTSEKLETTIKWNDLYDFNTTKIQDVFELMPDKEVRLLRDTNPGNLSYLVESCVYKLAQLTRVEIQNETTGEVFGLDFSQPTTEDFKRILNILRIVTRLLPLCHEDSLDNDFKRLESRVYIKIRKILKSILFFPGFTLPKTVDNGSNVVVHYTEKIENFYEHIWAPGIGYCRDVVITSELLLNRIECLRLVLLLLQIDEFCDKEPELDWCLPFFTSLVNSIFTASITWSVNTLYGAQLDYINYILTSLNLLITRNEIFSEFSARLNCDQDYEFILNGISALLKFDEGFCEPLATFLWNILSVNSNFANFFVKQSTNFNTILTALLLHLYSSSNQNYNIVALQTMFYLSTSRNFCIRLNKDFLFTKYISCYTNYKAANLIPNFQGTFFDFIIITLGEMKTHQNSAITNGKFTRESTTSTTSAHSTANYFSAKLLVNSSYFVKNLSMTASNIFFNKIFARDPSFTILFVANLLQFQFDTNSNFVFAMISHKTSLTNDRVPKNATVKKSMDVLIPQMEQLHQGRKVSNEQDLLAFLQNSTLIGLLPQRPNVELFPFSKDSKECKKWSMDYVAKFLVDDFEPDIPSLYVDFQRVGEVV